MEIGAIAGDSYEYAKESVWEKWGRWILLLIAYLINTFTFDIIPLFSGYLLRVLSGTKPAPEIDDWWKLFIDGWKVNLITIVYFIIPLVIGALIVGISYIPSIIASGISGGSPDILAAGLGASVIIGIFAAIFIAFVFALFYLMGLIRFAKTGSMGEAFNFKAILAHIGSIGWGSYILSLIVLIVILIVAAIILSIIMIIPVLGIIIFFVLQPPISIFSARYLTAVYESAPA
jgi:hypothetical protein